MKTNLFFLICLLVLVGCQASGGGGSAVVDNHLPTANVFTLSTTLNKNYSSGQTITFTLSFPAVVTVTGTPQLSVTVGSSNKIASYVSGSGSKSLVFQYTVANGDNDSDGISVGSTVNLNGGTMVYGGNNVACPTSFTPPTLPSVKVDTLNPSVSTMNAPASMVYIINQSLLFTANFSEPVFVTGTPRIPVTIGSTAVYANYVSGSGTSSLMFTYAITGNDEDTDGIAMTSPVDINGGTVKDAAGNSASLTYGLPNTSSVIVMGKTPFAMIVNPPANGTYITNQTLDFNVGFSKAVTVSGTPRLVLTIGSSTKYATYVSGSGTTSLNFRYTVAAGDTDTDGISLASTLDFNGGNIQDSASHVASPFLPLPTLTGVKVSATATTPIITNVGIPVSPPATGYDLGQTVDFTVTWSEAMVETGGTSRLKLDVGGVTRYATYTSGTGTTNFTYRYTVQANDEDMDGLAVTSPLELNGATIANASSTSGSLLLTPPNTSSLKVDARAPTIASNTVPANGTYVSAQNLDFDVTFTEPVAVSGTPRVVIDVGGSPYYANYLSGNGTATLRFRYTIGSSESDSDGISINGSLDLNGGTIKDGNLHSAALTLVNTATSGVLIDNTAPTILSITPPANNTYGIGQALSFTVNWSENVTVTGVPQIAITVGSATKMATYVSGSGTNALIFTYTVANSDSDTDGIAVTSPLQLNSGTIKDAALNIAVLTFTPPTTTGVLVSGSNPTISSITLPANGRYTTGQNVDIDVVFSEAVVVSGTPRMELTLDSGTVYANYLSGSSSATLKFRYTVAANSFDINGIALVSPLDLNGGTIKNVPLSLNASLTYTLPNSSGIKIDGLDPIISSVTPPANKTYILGENLDFIVNYDSNVTVTGVPHLSFSVGGSTVNASYLSGSGTAALTFRYTVVANDSDNDGITLSSPLSLNGGSIADPFGDTAGLTFSLPNTTGVLIDAVAPLISSVAGPSPGLYYLGDNLDLDVVFSKSVNIVGTPRIALTVGSSTKYATYLTGSGTTLVKFRYTVGTGDLDSDGIAVVSPLDLNSGTVKDLNGNNLSPLTFTVPNTTLVNVDGTAPSITGITPPANATYKTSQNMDFTVVFSKPVTVTGSPSLQLTIGSSTVNANYLSGSGTANIVFRYTVASGDVDSDGIALVSPVLLNSGTIKDPSNLSATLTFTPPATSGILVDGIDLVVSTITPPVDGTYHISQNLDFTVTFNSAAVVTGTPRLVLSIGSSTKYATYVSGSGTNSLLFSYTVVAGDQATTGISLSSNIDLNGGTIKDSFGDSANVAFSGATYPLKKVDGTVAQIISVTPPTDGTYYLAENLDFDVEFDESINITGSPALEVVIGSTTRLATYLSGTGSNIIRFRYTLATGDNDGNGIALGNLILNGGTVKDTGGNNASLTFTAPNTSGIITNTDSVNITSVSVPAGKYNTSTYLDVAVTFERAVYVTGTPQVEMTIGSSTINANYLSGSGTSTLTFRHTVAAGESDTDGIALVSPLKLSGGTIQDATAINANLVFTPPTTSSVLVDGIDLVISSVTPPAAKTYALAENLDFDVAYTYPATVTGTPRIALTVGSTTKYATYLSGSGTTTLKFRYTVQSGDLDSDGITTSAPIELNSGTMKDAFGDNASLTFTAGNVSGVNVDGILPSISSVSGPTGATYYANANLDFTVNFSETVNITGTPRIQLTIGAATKYATYVSGSGSTAATFRYTVLNGDTDLDGISVSSVLDLNSGTIKDPAGNDLASLSFTAPNTSSVLVDANNASISSVTPPANAVYKTGNNLDFTVAFTRSVTVTGTPRIALTVGAATLYANYTSGSGTSNLVFRYTVTAGDIDSDGITMTSPVSLNGGTIIDSTSGNASLSFTSPNLSGVKVDGVDIALGSVTPPADATYITGQNLDFVATFNYAPVITGTPRLVLTVGAATKYANYLSATGNTVTFRYTVTSGDVAASGISVLSNIDLNSGTIKDSFGDNAVITFAGASFPNKKVDGIAPTLLSVTAPVDGTYDVAQNLDFTVSFSENVTITGTPRIAVQIGAQTRYATYTSGAGTSSAVFRYTIVGSDNDTDGIAVSSPLDLNGGSIADVAGNSLSSLTFTPPTTTGILVAGNTAVAANSTITGTGPVVANGTSTSTVTITLKNALNIPVAGIVPTFSATDTGTTNVYGICSATNASGVSTCTLASTKAETKTLSITYPVTKSDGTVVFTAGAATIANSSITGTGPVTADGVASSTVTITLKDSFNNPVAGTVPTFSATNTGTTNVYGTCSSTSATGVSTCTLKSTKAESKTLSIQTPVVKTGGTVVFVAGAPSVANSYITGTTPVSADGISTSFIEISLKDAFNNPVSGIVPIFNATNTNNTNAQGACSATDGLGISACTLSATYAEVKVLQLTSPIAITGSSVEFSGTLPTSQNSSITGSGPVIADDTSTSTITITLRDSNNNLVDLPNGELPTFAATDTGISNAYSDCLNQSTGIYTCTMTSRKAETKTLSITSPLNKIGGTVSFIAGPVASSFTSILGTSPVVADGIAASTITITLKDQYDNAVAGTVPTFSATDAGTTNTQTTCSSSNVSGVATCTLKSLKAETKTLQLLTPISKTGGTVVFTGGVPVAANSTISGTGPVNPDGTSTSTITIILKDANLNPSAGVVPTFTATDSGANNSYGSCTSSDATGHSTCTLASLTPETKTLSIATPFVKAGGTVIFQTGSAVAANSTITGSGPVVANGTAVSNITITLRDNLNAPVTGVIPTFSASGTNNNYGTCSATNSSGVSTCTLSSTKAELKNLSIDSPVVKVDGSVTFIAGPAVAANSTISASDPNLADGVDTCEVTINLKDANNNAVSGVVPTFALTGTLNTLQTCPATDSSGQAICLATSTKAEAKTVSLVTPVAITGNTVDFNPNGINIQVPIELVDRGLSSTTTAVTFARSRTSFNTLDYVSESNEYYFEIVVENTNTTTPYSVLLYNSSNATVATITVPASTNPMKRLRVAFTPTSGANNYRVRLPATSTAGQLKVHSAKIIVNQFKATATKIYIPLTGAANTSDISNDTTTGIITSTTSTSFISIGTATTSTSLTGLAYVWNKIAANYDAISLAADALTLETVTYNSQTSGVTTVGLFNKTTGLQVTGIQTTSTGKTTTMSQKTFANNVAGFADNNDFEVRLKTSTGTGYLHKAGLWIKLKYLKKTDIIYRLSARNYVTTTGTTAVADSRTLYEIFEWSNPSAFFEVQGQNPAGTTASINLIDYNTTDSGTTGTTVSSLSPTTTYGRSRSGAISLTDLDRYGVTHTVTAGTAAYMGGAFLIIQATE